jgi:hypothetical protein
MRAIRQAVRIDVVAKSCHSRLSGIVVHYKILIRDDSGQAGMTSKEGYATFYESIKIAIFDNLPY